MWVMWPITAEHPRAASEYSRPIARLVEQLVWTVWKGNDVKCAAWLNAAKLPAVQLKKKLCFLPRVILLSNFALMGAANTRICQGERYSWVLEAAWTGMHMGALLRVHQAKSFLFTFLFLQNHTSTPARAGQRCILQAHPGANVIWIKDFQGQVIRELNCPENQQRLRVFHQYQPHLGASCTGKEHPKPTVQLFDSCLFLSPLKMACSYKK